MSWLLLFCWPAQTHALDAEPENEVWLVAVELTGAYDTAITSFRNELASTYEALPVRTLTPEQTQRLYPRRARVIVTFGLQAASEIGTALAPSIVVNALLPSYGFHSVHQHRTADERQRLGAVFIDQPVSRQVNLIREALPGQRDVAIIASPASMSLADELSEEAQRQGLSVKRRNIPDKDSLYDAMQETLDARTVLLALPDRNLYNANTVQNILLTSFRERSAVIGFSAAYVKAGALVSVHSSPEQVGAEAAQIVSRVLDGVTLPPPRFPEQFTVGINPTVSRSLGVFLDSSGDIEERLKQLEEPR